MQSGLFWIIQFWIQTKCSFGINFEIWGSETAERFVLINILREKINKKKEKHTFLHQKLRSVLALVIFFHFQLIQEFDQINIDTIFVDMREVG